MAGRPPKPTKLKLLHGTARADRVSPLEPMLEPRELKPPSWLSPKAKHAFRSLAKLLGPAQMKVATDADRMALELLCDSYSEWREAREVIQKEGQTYETETSSGSVMIRPRPEVTIASDAWRRVHRMLVEFGLTPSSKTKVQSSSEEASDPFEEFLKGVQ